MALNKHIKIPRRRQVVITDAHLEHTPSDINIDTTQHGPLSGRGVWASGGSIEKHPSL